MEEKKTNLICAEIWQKEANRALGCTWQEVDSFEQEKALLEIYKLTAVVLRPY